MQSVGAGCLIIFTYPGQNSGKQLVSTTYDNYQGQCQNQWVLWTARLGPCSVMLQGTRTPLTCWDPLLRATALSLHRTFTEANLHQHVARGAPPHPNTQGQLHTPPRCIRACSSPLPHGIRPCFCLKLPMFLYGPVLHQCSDTNLCVNYSKVSVKLLLKTVKYWSDNRLVISPMVSLPQMNLKNQEMFCFSFSLNQWKRNVFFLMLDLWVIRSAGSTSAISLSYRRADTGQGGQHLGTAPDTFNRATLWQQHLDQPACISHLSSSSATAELTRRCDGACSGFQHIRNNANDIICFVCITVWCLENKHLGFVSMFIFNKYLSFVSTIISPQQTIIQ